MREETMDRSTLEIGESSINRRYVPSESTNMAVERYTFRRVSFRSRAYENHDRGNIKPSRKASGRCGSVIRHCRSHNISQVATLSRNNMKIRCSTRNRFWMICLQSHGSTETLISRCGTNLAARIPLSIPYSCPPRHAMISGTIETPLSGRHSQSNGLGRLAR